MLGIKSLLNLSLPDLLMMTPALLSPSVALAGHKTLLAADLALLSIFVQLPDGLVLMRWLFGVLAGCAVD